MISFQHVLVLTSPPLSPPPLAVSSKSSRSTTPLAENTVHGQAEQELQSTVRPEGSQEDELIMEPSQEIQEELPSQLPLEHETSANGFVFPDISRYDTISISETANLFRDRIYQKERCRRWRAKLQFGQKTAALTPRLLRTGELSRKALVKHFKQGDKANFVLVYNAIHDLREALKTTWRAPTLQDDPGFTSAEPEEPVFNIPSTFMERLTPRSKGDVLEFLRLVRTNPEFLADRIGSLSNSQLSALTSSTHLFNVTEPALPVPSRGRSQASSLKRGSSLNLGFPDHVLDFERTDPLSVMLFNVFDLSQGYESPDSGLRLDVWTSTCARLLNGSGSTYHQFISDLASTWTTNRDWSVKPRLELYLMDILEKGAFLLERIEDPFVGFNRSSTTIDPLSTEVAEEFFDRSVQDLFDVLDEPFGGLPIGALELCHSILHKLEDQETRDRFREHFFLHWYFSKYLWKALIYPEGEGMLLGFHVKKDARLLLRKVASRALTQASGLFNQLSNSAITEKTRSHLQNMFSRMWTLGGTEVEQSTSSLPNVRKDLHGPTVVLSALDVHTALSALFPGVDRNLFSWDQQSSRSVSSSVYSMPFKSEQLGSPSRPTSVFDYSGTDSLQRPETRSTEISSNHLGQPFHRGQLNVNQEAVPSQFLDLYRRLEHSREELFQILSLKGPSNRIHPCAEDWVVLSFQGDGNDLLGHYLPESSGNNTPSPGGEDDVPAGNNTSRLEEQEQRRLEEAILEVMDEMTELEENQAVRSLDGARTMTLQSLDELFAEAMDYSKSQSDYVKAHHWWDARQLLFRLKSPFPQQHGQVDVLQTLLQASQDSIDESLKVIRGCERSFSRTQRSLRRFDAILKFTFEGLAKLRDKMWYMTDVKHSSKYEEAKNVALALKTMGYPATVRRNYPNPPPRLRTGSSSSSVLQSPEVQTMNIMKTSADQGGPNKLADDQVDMTRKWLKKSGIENFCQGEERIHRFCLEIKTSVSRIVGETMADGPVLWASDLYQLERGLYDSQTTRPPSIRNGIRPSSITSEDSLFAIPPTGSAFRSTEGPARMGYEPYIPSSTKMSSPSLVSERWRVARDKENFDNGSVDDSPGKAVSTSTVESYNTFWSPLPAKIRSSTSVSSFRSRPSSIYNDAVGPKTADRLSGAKIRFLDDLRQTLTSLLLSDLGSPVWSMGSETDAWFSTTLAQERVRVQAEKEERKRQTTVRRGSTQSLNDLKPSPDSIPIPPSPARQRSKSAQPSLSVRPVPSSEETVPTPVEASIAEPNTDPPPRSFSYKEAFRGLLEKVSRHSNPFAKLNALHELRLLIISSLIDDPSCESSMTRKDRSKAVEGGRTHSDRSPHTPEGQIGDAFGRQPIPTARFSHPHLVLPFESPAWTAADGVRERNLSTNAVIDALRDLLREAAPKTLFRDLQFIAAFVPSDILNKTERGIAFLDAGVAALGLKQDVCQTMVEIADRIVVQEINRRSPLAGSSSRREYTLADAAKMWIITAKEGNAVAQRELAILYLTHPELLPRVTLPMTMPRETFRAEMMYRRNDDRRSDPQNMCLALHWMQLSANGGDELAKNNLREREEFDSFP